MARAESLVFEAFMHSPEALAVVDEAGSVVLANHQAQALLGSRLSQRWHEEPWFTRALDSGQPVRDATLRLDFGSPSPFEVSAVPLDTGELVVSVRRWSWASWAQNLGDIVDHAAIVLFALAPDGTFTVSEGRGLAALGLGRGEVVGRSVFDVYRDNPGLLEHARRALTGEELIAIDRVPAVGRTFETRWTPIRDHGGSIATVVGVAVDVTERDQAMQRSAELAEAAERRAAELSGIVQHIVDAVLVIDGNERLTLMNAAAAKLVGRDSTDVVGHTLDELTELLATRSPRGSPIAREQFPPRRALRGETIEAAHVAVTLPQGGLRQLRVSSAPVRDRSGAVRASVTVARDVTDEVAFEQMKDQFVLTAAHELRTPLAVIRGHAERLQRSKLVDRPQQRASLDGISRGAGRLHRIVTNLITTLQVDSGDLRLAAEPLDFDELIRDVIREHAQGSRHRIVASLAPGRIRGDAIRLAQVVRALLDNARKFSPEGAEITMRLVVERQRVRLSVQDRGPGIPRQGWPRVFERFSRAQADTATDRAGMGVELYLARQIVRGHGGELDFETEMGRGTTFFVELPRMEGDAG
jgi:PAS domain S-box-containing protein